ncbi:MULTISPECIES: MerR family transcriptional regulator [Rhodococcus]|uniref:MerR family transcriptional regulator n=1 Tax=Rhodococcus TaxID=1827 RepID=UPI0003155FA3|nr:MULTISPECIES: MerR family transcriptional regulator [Rhodococcus]KXF52198.1 MerR family transcriptional regulator [Rhodococcus sp. SC4]KXX61313.1 MerR family transcriptional regulator [Rhodococcus sp. LB1]UDG98742.1 MerR family transcriptional regulator [Rhodococcus opacus PD630]
MATQLEQSPGAFASISEVSAITGLTQDTLRWYEREGMIPRIARGSDRRRRYSERDVRLIELLVKLRTTGMPTSDMQRFAVLLTGGAETHERRLSLLLEHRERILAQQARLDDALAALDTKVDHYRALIAGTDEDRARQRRGEA